MRYQYTSQGSQMLFRPQGNPFPPGVKMLIIINVVVFFILELSGLKGELFRQFGMVPYYTWHELKIWQPFTYLFLHSGFTHIFVNMFVLWMFGRELESLWGKKEFLRYYFITGIGAGIITMLFHVTSVIPVVGASGAIYGLLLAYGVMYPERKVYVYFFIPVKVKYFVAVLAGVAFFASLSPGQSVISHLTHLSGMFIGLIYLKAGKGQLLWKRFRLKQELYKMKRPVEKKSPPGESRNQVSDQLLKRRVDEILDKMNNVGWENLTEVEKNILYGASKKFTENQPPN